MFSRACPSCGRATINVFSLMLWRVRCRACKADVGTHPAWRLPVLSMEMTVWVISLNWLYRDQGRLGLVLSLLVWAAVDLAADCLVPLVARKR